MFRIYLLSRLALPLFLWASAVSALGAQQKARAGALGVAVGTLSPGRWNAGKNRLGDGQRLRRLCDRLLHPSWCAAAFPGGPWCGARSTQRFTVRAVSGGGGCHEEAIYNSLFMATTVRARNATVDELPAGEVLRLLKERHALSAAEPSGLR